MKQLSTSIQQTLNVFALTLSLFIIMHTAYAQAPQLWGTCEWGGALNYGAIIKADSTGTDFHVVYSFDYINGAAPVGNLCDGGNGKLYGVTDLGGWGDSCVVYYYDTSTGNCTNFHNLFQNIDSGWNAWSGMMRAADGMLYGVCASGGLNSGGVLYRVDPSIDSYSPLYNFTYATGDYPEGGLIQLSDGKLYGMSSYGGQYSGGVIFSFNPLDNTYLDLYDFDSLSGVNPMFSSLLRASDGKLYGLTQAGGANNTGVIFSYDPDNNIYNDLHDFNSTDGANPYGSLMQATNGLLYGMTSYGGTNQNGVLFSYNLSTQSLSVLYNFTTAEGTHPQRSLTQGSNGKLFGTMPSGGLFNAGTAFSFDISSNTFNKLIDFYSIGCSGASCDILETGKAVATSIPSVNNTGEITTYPNPVTDNVMVTGEILTPKTQVELWNDQGKRILDFIIKGNTLNVSNLPAGVYILKITSGNTASVTKFIKQ